MRTIARSRKGEEGSTAVEFAVILPVFLLLIFSLIDFGRYFYTRVVITNASIEVASAVTRGLYVEGDSASMKSQKITAVLNNVAPGLGSFAQLSTTANLSFNTPLACPNSVGQTMVNLSTTFSNISPFTAFLPDVSSQTTMWCVR